MVINTSRGPVDDRFLVKKEGGGIVEYYLGGELVHRSVIVQLTGAIVAVAAQNF